MNIKPLLSMPLLSRASRRFFTQHPWQLWLTLLSIALGTAVIIAVDLANVSAGKSFDQSVRTLAGEMTHEITAYQGLVPDAFYHQLRVEWGYRDSSPQLETTLVREGLQYTLLGVDPFALPGSDAGGLNVSIGQLTQLLTEPGAVLLTQKLAQRFEVTVGDALVMDVGGEPLAFTVVAVAEVEGAGGDIIFTDISTVQEVMAGVMHPNPSSSTGEGVEAKSPSPPLFQRGRRDQQSPVPGRLSPPPLKKAGAGEDFSLHLRQPLENGRARGSLSEQNSLMGQVVKEEHELQPRLDAGITRIQLKLTPVQAEELQSRLPTTLKLESFQQRQQVFTQMTQAFSTNLLAMSLLAMLVGAFLVYNTMTFSVLQRRQTFAVARMVGVTGGQLFRHLLLEALLLGLVGSVLGIFLGILLGQGLLVLISQTISDLFIRMNASDFLVSPQVLIKGVSITMLSVFVATLAPALEAARVQPVLVQRRSHLEQGSQRIGLSLAASGVALILLSGLVLGLSGRSLLLGFIGLFLLILGYSLCVPLVLRLVLRVLQGITVVRRISLIGRMTVRGVQVSLSRTSLAIIALTVAVSATVGVSIMVGSFRSSVADWLEMTLSSDLYVSATPPGGSNVAGRLHDDWILRLKSLPAVASVSSGRTAQLTLDDLPVSALVLEPGPHSGKGFAYLSGDAESIWQQYLAGEGILVSEPFAYHRGKQSGDMVKVNTELAGEVRLPILGVFRDYSATQGMVSMPRVLYERYWSDRSRSSIGIKLRDSTQLSQVMQQLTVWADELNVPDQPLVIRSNQAIREMSLAIFDRTFAITNVLRLLVIIVAFVGVFSALMALFLERGREFGILRATGFTPLQLRYLVLGQTALIGLLAGLLSLPLGWMMSDILIDIINRRSFGWTMDTYFFAWVPVQAILLALVAALLAGIYPVKRIGRLKVRESLVG